MYVGRYHSFIYCFHCQTVTVYCIYGCPHSLTLDEAVDPRLVALSRGLDVADDEYLACDGSSVINSQELCTGGAWYTACQLTRPTTTTYCLQHNNALRSVSLPALGFSTHLFNIFIMCLCSCIHL